ncbi:unnamed protein product, partial [Symbiodinium microadriaticum]
PRPRPHSAGPVRRSWGSFLEVSDGEESGEQGVRTPGRPSLDISLAKKNEALLRMAAEKVGWE